VDFLEAGSILVFKSPLSMHYFVGRLAAVEFERDFAVLFLTSMASP